MRKNRILTLTKSKYLLVAFEGTEDFKNYWDNFIYNYFGDLSLEIKDWTTDHFRIIKKDFEPMLKLAIKTEIRLKHRSLNKIERQNRVRKVLDFYLNRVIVNVGARNYQS